MIQFNKKLVAIALAIPVSFTAWAEDTNPMQMGGMQEGGMQQSSMKMMVHCPMKLDANQFEKRELSAEVKNDLLFMREEEKLARDVYQELYIKWFSSTHGNIADQEQSHMDRIGIFLEAYGLEDSASEDEGVYNNADLQALYDDLVAQGSLSELDAFKVGAFIEEVDIQDLNDAIKNTDIPELKKMYGQLKNSSYMHLRKFDEQIVKLGESYSAQVLTQEAYDAILNTKGGMMLMGNGSRVTANGEMGTNACFVSSLSADEQTLQTGSKINEKQEIKISYQVDVDPNDVGKAADWILAASYMSSEGEPTWFVRDGKQWKVWDLNLENLSAAMSSDGLQMMQTIPVFDGILSGLPGDFSIYAGYRVKGGDLVFNPAALKLSVQP